MALRILFLGENWFGSCARACCYALRRLGHDVVDVDSQTFFPAAGTLPVKAALRLVRPALRREYNRRVLDVAERFEPDFLLAFKGTYLDAATLAGLRRRGVRLYNYFPDRMALFLDTPLAEAVPEYDVVFDTKRSWDGDAAARVRPRELVFLPHGYDPELHRPVRNTAADVRRFGSEVSFVGNHSERKAEILGGLVSAWPEVPLRIWGHGWRERAPALAPRVVGPAVTGPDYARAIAASAINLGVMGVVSWARDETSTRTYEIPACGGFMLHERTDELLREFEEGREVACFDGAGELAEKVRHYLARPAEREQVARAGYARCVPAYAYDARMAEIVRRHLADTGRAAEAGGAAAREPAVA